MDFQPTLCVDFDGVIHSYVSGWKGLDRIDDPPVDGAFDWLEKLITYVPDKLQRGDKKIRPVIYSTRSKSPEGIRKMQEWFSEHGFDDQLLNQLEFVSTKPAAFLTLDDRAICFDGTFPTQETMLAFEPWNRRYQPQVDHQVSTSRIAARDITIDLSGDTEPFIALTEVDSLKRKMQGKRAWTDASVWQLIYAVDAYLLDSTSCREQLCKTLENLVEAISAEQAAEQANFTHHPTDIDKAS